MTITPPVVSTTAPQRPAVRWPGWVAWLVILVSLGAIIMPRFFPAEAGVRGSMQLELLSRYAVGVQQIMPPQPQRNIDTLASLVRKAAGQNGFDQLRLAVILAELQGRAAALQQLDQVRRDYPRWSADASMFAQIYRAGPEPIDGPTRAALIAHYGWFAHLALGFGQPAGDPERQAALGPAIKTTVTIWATLLLALGLLAAGLAVMVVTLVLRSRRKLPLQFRAIGPSTAPLEAFAIYMAAMAALMVLSQWVFGYRALWMNWLMLLAVPVALLWPRARGLSWPQWREALGLVRGRGILREICCGLLGYLAGVPLLALGMLATLLLSRMFRVETSHPIMRELQGSRWHLVEIYLLAAVWAPVTEELAFRGALLGHLRQRFGWAVSAGAVALIFAAVHPQGWIAIPPLAAIAMTLAAIREWRGSIIGAMAAHAVHNALVTTVAALMLR